MLCELVVATSKREVMVESCATAAVALRDKQPLPTANEKLQKECLFEH